VELVSLAPDVIVTSNRPATTAVQEQTKTIPIIFTAGNDVRPVCVCHQWRKKPPGELSIAAVADERLGWVTIWVGAL